MDAPKSESSVEALPGQAEPQTTEIENGPTIDSEAIPDPQGRQLPPAENPIVDPLELGAREEEKLLIPVVQLLDRDEAIRWLGSFIIETPAELPDPHERQVD